MERCIANLQPYEHGSSHAVRRKTAKGEIYEVYSYTTLVFSYDLTTGVGIYWSDRTYSQTTSRLQNIIKRQFNVEGISNTPPEDKTEEEGLSQLRTVASVMSLGDIIGENQKERNDWKTRMLRAGLDGRGLIMPDDWDELDEDTKTARLDAVIKELA
jgi:hypothetical protein